ncbi:hypothetical protein QZH41_011283, partial [Actinostola sp. cb2023]
STKMSDTSLSVFEIRVNAVKPWTLPSSILPVLLGTLLAYKSGQPFDPFPFILCSFVIIGTHAAGNFVNSYYEAKNRRFTRPRERNTTVHETARSAVATYCIVSPSFALLLVSSAADIWQELALFLAGFIASVLFGKYLKNIALGELVVSAVYGPLCVMFTYAVQVGSSRRELSGSLVALYSLPLALCTECMLHSQNIRDMKVDKERGAHTLALLLGNSFALGILPLFLLGPHLVTSVLALQISKYFFFPLLSLPLAMLSLPQYEEEVVVLPQKIAVVGLVFGLLYLLSFLYAF